MKKKTIIIIILLVVIVVGFLIYLDMKKDDSTYETIENTNEDKL